MRMARNDVVVRDRREVTTDSEGRPVADERLRRVRGHVATPRVLDREMGGQLGVDIDLVVLFPSDSGVERHDRITVDDAGPILDGDYRIETIVPTPKHFRMLCSRKEP